MKNNKKISTLILVLVLMITAVISGTFAYWQWITSTEQQTLVNVSLTDDATIYIDFPSNELTNLYPTSDCEANGTSSWVTDITVNNGTGVKLATNFKLKIKIEDKDGNVITNGTNEWNDHDYKYYVKFAVTEANESCKNALYTGRFDTNNLTYQNVAANDEHYAERTYWYDSSSITLKGDDGFPVVSSRIGSGVSFHAYPNTETSHTYKVWVWLDEDYTSVTVGEDSTLDKLQDAKITVSWSENSELEQIRESAEPEGEAIAIFSEDDMSLRFYREKDPDSIGSTYNGRPVTRVVKGFENSSYTSYFDTPWGNLGGYENEDGSWISYSYYLREIVFEDYIYPTSTAYWFSEGNELKSIDVTKLDTSNVTDMRSMFFADYSGHYNVEIIGLENWDVSNVTNMKDMFGSSSVINEIDLSNWNVCNVTEYDNFSSAENIEEPYFGDDAKCNRGDPKPNYNPRAGEAIAIYSESDSSLRFYRVEDPYSIGSTYNGRPVTEVYTGFETAVYSLVYDEFENAYVPSAPWSRTEAEIVVFEDYIYPVSTAYWFYWLDYVETIDVTKLNTSNVTNMSGMFALTSSLSNITGIEKFNTSEVTNMSEMFKLCSVSSLDLSTFDTSKVTNMDYMFENYYGTLTGIQNWNVCKVTDYESFSSTNIIEPNWGMTCP